MSDRAAGAAELRGPSTSYVEGPLPMSVVHSCGPTRVNRGRHAERNSQNFRRPIDRTSSSPSQQSPLARRERSFWRRGAAGSAEASRSVRFESVSCAWVVHLLSERVVCSSSSVRRRQRLAARSAQPDSSGSNGRNVSHHVLPPEVHGVAAFTVAAV